ncbi:hypothetical protein [Actinomadura violacea]|uniref:Integrase n=1 Tax=Actinomadura violacea TaxID=2819934 RepID=A0ABS3RZG1_9ACTN|nr:hypothetical protein [Actinomadura violacea]MBO2462134.1 hypothetical protein [Actinomadura violacea]
MTAYAERRGDYYRGRYKNPPAVEGVSVEEWRRLPEGLRRPANGGRDPSAGDITLAAWLEAVWWPAQDLADRTVDRYTYCPKGQILPTFGVVRSTRWSTRRSSAPGSGACSLSTASKARALLSTILADAKAARLVEDNCAARLRGRSRRRGRVHRQGPRDSRKAWPTGALLVAERCALLTGQDDDLVMWLTCAWCALRWGELIGLQPEPPPRQAVRGVAAPRAGRPVHPGGPHGRLVPQRQRRLLRGA